MSHYHCDACRTSKSHKLPFSIYVHKSTKPLELIHSNVWGPTPILSHFGFSNYVLFIDEFSKYTWLFPLRKKVMFCLSLLSFELKSKNSSQPKLFLSSLIGGGGFQPLTTYLKEHDIHHRVYYPYTPEQNGIAEWKHIHLIETTLTLLKNASLLESFWDEVVSIATFLISQMTTPILQNKLPYEVLFNILPDYKILHTFSCLCYPHL